MREKVQRRKICIFGGMTLFYIVMLLLTVIGRRVHDTGLPEVRGIYPEMFSYSDGICTSYKPGLPIQLKNQPVFQIVCREKNGEERYYAKQVTDMEILEERKDVFLVGGELNGYQMIICEGMENVRDGSEVLLINEEDLKPWN